MFSRQRSDIIKPEHQFIRLGRMIDKHNKTASNIDKFIEVWPNFTARGTGHIVGYVSDLSNKELTHNRKNILNGILYFKDIEVKTDIDKKKLREARKILRIDDSMNLGNNFKLSITEKEFLNYQGIDQGQEGACAFVGFLNLLTINDIKIPIHNNWERIWNIFPGSDENGLADIASMLDGLIEMGHIKHILKNILYIPIKALQESYLNPLITKTKNIIHNITKLITNYIDDGYSVLINSHEHTRVCVGYNDNYFMFADSWGNDTVEIEFDDRDRLVNLTKNGFSFAPKIMIASYVREIVIIKNKEISRQKM